MIVLGLGSNKGDRAENLRAAVATLKPVLSDLRCSPVYESSALLPKGAPKEWDAPFLNMAVRGESDLSPRALLDAVRTLETQLGRTQEGHWGPRVIDIDILAYDEQVVQERDLMIPHPGLLLRDFALVPFADIAPQWRYPGGGPVCELVQRMPAFLLKTDIVIA